jgi:hypothetical protein
MLFTSFKGLRLAEINNYQKLQLAINGENFKDTSQLGDGNFYRNGTFNGKFIKLNSSWFSSMMRTLDNSSFQPLGIVAFDFVSTNRPSKAIPPSSTISIGSNDTANPQVKFINQILSRVFPDGNQIAELSSKLYKPPKNMSSHRVKIATALVDEPNAKKVSAQVSFVEKIKRLGLIGGTIADVSNDLHEQDKNSEPEVYFFFNLKIYLTFCFFLSDTDFRFQLCIYQKAGN